MQRILIGNFKGVQGPQGVPGPRGFQGVQGPQGVQGLQGNARITATNSGNIVELQTCKANIIELYVNGFTKQGADPSPTNIQRVEGLGVLNSSSGKYEIPIKTTTLNSFDMDDAFSKVPGWTKTSDYWSGSNGDLGDTYKTSNGGYKVDCKPNTGYTFAITYTNTGNVDATTIIRLIYSDGTQKSTTSTVLRGNTNTLTVVSDSTKTVTGIAFSYVVGNTSTFRVDSAYLEPTGATDLMTYEGSTITLALSTPLYEDDVLCKYYDGSGEIIRHKGRVNLGALSWTKSDTLFYADISRKKPGLNNLLCDIYKVNPTNASSLENYEITGTATTRIYIRDPRSGSMSTLGNGYYVIYELATPERIPLTSSEVALIESLKSFEAHTIINSPQNECNITASFFNDTLDGEVVSYLYNKQ